LKNLHVEKMQNSYTLKQISEIKFEVINVLVLFNKNPSTTDVMDEFFDYLFLVCSFIVTASGNTVYFFSN